MGPVSHDEASASAATVMHGNEPGRMLYVLCIFERSMKCKKKQAKN